MKKTPARPRDPAWRLRRALGHKVTADRTRYIRKTKHRKNPRHDDRGGFFVGGRTGVRVASEFFYSATGIALFWVHANCAPDQPRHSCRLRSTAA